MVISIKGPNTTLLAMYSNVIKWIIYTNIYWLCFLANKYQITPEEGVTFWSLWKKLEATKHIVNVHMVWNLIPEGNITFIPGVYF